MKFKYIVFSALIGFSAIIGSQAQAALLKFTLTGRDAETWVQDSNPTPLSFDANQTDIAVTNGVATKVNGSPVSYTFSDVQFFTTGFFGGYQDGFAVVNFLKGINTYGSQLFGGTTGAPTFVTTSSPILLQDPSDLTFPPNGTGVDTLTISAVPEPATWAMMLIGFAGIGFVAYRRAKKSSALLAAI